MEKLWLVWKEPIERKRYTIGELIYKDYKYTFRYLKEEVDIVCSKGFDFFPGFPDLDKIYESDVMFSNISTRLPNPARPDYLEILNLYNLSLDNSLMDILARTKGKLLTDNFEFIKVFNKAKSRFDIAGTRYYISEELRNVLKVNDKVSLVKDSSNLKDSYAVKVVYKNNDKEYILGYVPRYYSREVYKCLDRKFKYSAMIESLNLEKTLNDEEVSVCVKLIFDVDNCTI